MYKCSQFAPGAICPTLVPTQASEHNKASKTKFPVKGEGENRVMMKIMEMVSKIRRSMLFTTAYVSRVYGKALI